MVHETTVSLEHIQSSTTENGGMMYKARKREILTVNTNLELTMRLLPSNLFGRDETSPMRINTISVCAHARMCLGPCPKLRVSLKNMLYMRVMHRDVTKSTILHYYHCRCHQYQHYHQHYIILVPVKLGRYQILPKIGELYKCFFFPFFSFFLAKAYNQTSNHAKS